MSNYVVCSRPPPGCVGSHPVQQPLRPRRLQNCLPSSQSRQVSLLRRESCHLVPELLFLEAMITSPTCQLIGLGNVVRHVYGGRSRTRAARQQCEQSAEQQGRAGGGTRLRYTRLTRRTPAVRNKKEKKNPSLQRGSEKQQSTAAAAAAHVCCRYKHAHRHHAEQSAIIRSCTHI